MDRILTYPASLPLDTDVLLPQKLSMIAQGYALQAAYGANTVVVGLTCTPTSPASMQVSVGPGGIVTPTILEPTPYGSLAADTVTPLVKMGINTAASLFTITAPSIAGQSQNYLIQTSFTEGDDTPETLTYYNSLNPSQSFSGPNNSGTPQNTRREQRAALQLKVGTPANTGTQITPPVDQGWTGIYIVTVAFGQTSITSGNITVYPNAPMLAAFLSSHHGGVPGQAPKINLASEVTGVLAAANLPGAVGSSSVYAGNPNTHVAGTAASGSTPPTMCWDTVDDSWWTCVTSGTVNTAVWAATDNNLNIQVFSTPGTSNFTVPAGVTQVYGQCWGGGGGSGATWLASSSSQGGGGGAYCEGAIRSLTPGSTIVITVGAGGTGPAASSTPGAGTAGGTSSIGAFMSSTGGAGGLGASGAPIAGVASGGTATGGAFNISGGNSWGSYAIPAGMVVSVGGGSYGTPLANGGSNSVTSNGTPGRFPGGGSTGGCNQSNGGNGGGGMVVLRW